ncbi:nuclear transport factor 2 family protein [Streptomyces sp. AF1A]|uniref:nuclear transport factor 2 family protein n=1 Tax=Streptomyces sp. AF1A TaxID=3394350 RepID=UPI0039BD8FD8
MAASTAASVSNSLTRAMPETVPISGTIGQVIRCRPQGTPAGTSRRGSRSTFLDRAFQISGKELAEKTAAILGTAPTAHQGFLPEITVNGDTAVGTWAMEDYLSFPPGSSYKTGLHGYGEYHDTYRRVKGTWYISSTVLSRFRVDNVPNWTPPAADKR